jgi:hypothetical protein
MPLAGFLVAEGKQNFAGVVIAGMVGSVLGAFPLYYAGYLLGEERLKAFADKHGRWLTISRDDLERAKKWFDQHGKLAVMICRLVPGIRSLISIPASIAKMNMAAFFFLQLWQTVMFEDIAEQPQVAPGTFRLGKESSGNFSAGIVAESGFPTRRVSVTFRCKCHFSLLPPA